MTSLSLGIVGISTGAIIASCANQSTDNSLTTNNPSNNTPPVTTEPNTPQPPVVQHDNPDPASANSIITKSGESLTAAQRTYFEKLSNNITPVLENIKNLDWKLVTNQTKISEQIEHYKNVFSQNWIIKDWLAIVNETPNSLAVAWTSEQIKTYTNVITKQYNSFLQKNLLPTEDQIKELIKNKFIDENDASKFTSLIPFTSGFINFFADPESMIILTELLSKQAVNNVVIDANAWHLKLVKRSFEMLNMSIADLDTNSPFNVALNDYFETFFNNDTWY